MNSPACKIGRLGIYSLRNILKPTSIGFLPHRNMSFCSWVKEENYKDHFEPGVYKCVECGNALFSSRAKYEHDTPWPAFTQPVHQNSLTKVAEKGARKALKVSCGKCGNGLGHEFLKDGPDGSSSRF